MLFARCSRVAKDLQEHERPIFIDEAGKQKAAEELDDCRNSSEGEYSVQTLNLKYERSIALFLQENPTVFEHLEMDVKR